MLKETDRQLKELGKQIARLGEKFGGFTEGLALPSMEKILRQRFGMEVICPSVRVNKGGQHQEIDVLAYANGNINQVLVVKVKSHPREESIAQIKTLLERFRSYFPEHKEKTVFGILAAVDISPLLRARYVKACTWRVSTTAFLKWTHRTISSPRLIRQKRNGSNRYCHLTFVEPNRPLLLLPYLSRIKPCRPCLLPIVLSLSRNTSKMSRAAKSGTNTSTAKSMQWRGLTACMV